MKRKLSFSIREKLMSEKNKYSNINLFENRERARGYSARTRINKSIFSDYNKTNFPGLTQYSTLPSSNKNESLISKNKSNFSGNLIDKLYLTETKNNNYNKDISFYNVNNFNENFGDNFKKSKKYYYSNLNQSEYNSLINDLNKQNNEKILKFFEENLKKSRRRNKNKNEDLKGKSLKNFKREKLNIDKESLVNYINKTRERNLLHFTLETKKEKGINIKEINHHEADILNARIFSLKKTNELFNNQFYSKFCDYVKFLEIKKEIEKNKNDDLIQNIFKLKFEITQIYNKIRNIEYDRNIFFKWLFFQISVKEKKLHLPVYYKYILEEDENIFQKNLKLLSNKKSNFMRKESKIKKARFSFFEYKLSANANFFVEYNFLPKEEILRVRNYLKKPIFNNIEEFFEKYEKIKNEIMNQIDENDKLTKNLFEINKEKNILEKEKNKEIESTEKFILIKVKELQIQKNKKKLLKREIYKLKHHIKNIFKKKKKKKEKSSIFDIPQYIKKPKANLRNSLEKVFQTCLLIKIEDIKFPEKKKKSNNEILEKIYKIEQITNILINKIYLLKKNCNSEEYKRIYYNIEKMHKKEKSKLEKKEIVEKFNLLKEKIEEKKNKVYFLNKKPVKNYITYSKKRTKTAKKEKTNLNQPSNLEYLYNIFNEETEYKNYHSENDDESLD